MYYFEKERKLFPGKLPTKQLLCCHLIQLLLRFLKSTQEIYVQPKELKTERERLYQAALQSQMLGERRPMTVVSMAINFNAACHELGSQQFPGVDIEAQMSTKQKLLAAAMEEYHTQCREQQLRTDDPPEGCNLQPLPAQCSRVLEGGPESFGHLP